MKLCIRTALLLVACALPRLALAATPGEPAPAAAVPEPREYGFRPEWRRSNAWDYVGAGAAVGAFLVVHSLPELEEPRWHGPILFDQAGFDGVELQTRGARRRATKWSDHLRLVNVLHAIGVAPGVILGRGGGFDFAWEVSLMNIQGFALNAIGQRASHKFVGRTRPAKPRCDEDPDYDPACGSGWMNQSFFGGHVAVAFTGAGLACAHHLHADLLGDPLADALGCAFGLSVATAEALLRTMNGAHWPTDNLVGGGWGFVVGYGTASWLHYHPFWRGSAVQDVSLGPLPEAPGLSVQGRF